MKLLTSTWKDIEAYLKRNTGIIIPIGSIEQHGPTGFIGTDAICADIICDKIAEKYDVIVGPTLNI